jgi:hypothetical protein
MEKSNAGRRPNLRQDAATNTPMAPVAHRHDPDKIDTWVKEI